MSTLQLGTLVFEETARTGWVFSDLIDWFGQTDNKVEITERPQAHGAFAVSRSLRSSRAISFQAAYLGGSQAELEAAFDDLASVGAEGPVTASLTTPSGRSSRDVTVVVSSPFDHHGRPVGRVAVDLIAADSRRYAFDEDSAWESTPPPAGGLGLVWPAKWPLRWPGGGSEGRITLLNTGKAPSAPRFRLHGGFDSALITCMETGARIGLDRVVPVGSIVDIDVATRRAIIDGQSDVSRWLRFREWELIPPGASRTYQFDATGVVFTPGFQEELGRNWNLNPRLANSVTGWMTTGAAATLTPTPNGGQIDVSVGTSAPLLFQAADLPAAAGDSWSGSVELTVPAGFPAAAVQLRTFAYGMNAVVGASAPTVIQPGTTVVLAANSSAPLTSAATGVRAILYGNGTVAGARLLARFAMAKREATVGEYFDGSFPPAGDRSYGWAGPVDASVSIAFRNIPAVPTATLEGQVRSAWW